MTGVTVSAIRVLVVDDDPQSRDTLRRALEFDRGIRVTGEAGSGPEAVDRAAELAPDLVIMDVRMPGGDGVEATRTILERFPGTRVVALTAHAEAQTVRDMLEAGAIAYILKGAPIDELTAAIHKAVRGEGRLDERVQPNAVEDLRSLLQQERERRAEAERQARIREEFVQVMAHELRSPLTVIRGALTYLEGHDLGAEGEALVASAARRTDDLARIVESLEMLIEGPVDPDSTSVPAAEIEAAVERLGTRPDVLDLSQAPWGGIRPSYLSTAAYELISNAFKHGARPVEVRVYREGRHGVMVVSDAGDLEPDPELFGPFSQGDMSVTRERGGMGLGLFVASRICEGSGGKLTFRRDAGRTVAEARFLLADS